MEEPVTKTPIDHVESKVDINDLVKSDKANKILNEAGGRIALTPENNKRVLRKIDLYILPVVLGASLPIPKRVPILTVRLFLFR